MIEVRRDKKSSSFIIIRTDNEGFHRQLEISDSEIKVLLHMLSIYSNENNLYKR